MEKIDGKLLAKLPRAKRFYELAGKQLALMHSHDVIHGDFTPANIIVSGKKVFVIDFGLAEQNPDPEGKAIDLLLMKRSLPLEMYSAFEKSYIASGGSKSTLSALSKIELRGRYQKRTLG
jgi:Kae1-associated kinase Bud32